MTVIIKTTPVTCRFRKCPYNQIAPLAGSQECIGCEGLKPKKPDKMTLQEAVNWLGAMEEDYADDEYQKQTNALKLGAEALKRIQKGRTTGALGVSRLLPGETKD